MYYGEELTLDPKPTSKDHTVLAIFFLVAHTHDKLRSSTLPIQANPTTTTIPTTAAATTTATTTTTANNLIFGVLR